MRLIVPGKYEVLHRRKQRRRRVALFLLVLGLMLSGYTYLALRVSPVYTPETYDLSVAGEPTEIAWPASGLSALGAVGRDTVYATNNPDAVVPTASTIKLLTTLVVLDKKPLAPGQPGETIILSEQDIARAQQIAAEGGTYLPLRPGQTLSYREALEATLIISANNMSEKLAVWAYGDTAAFLEAARNYISLHGLEQTVITEPSGLAAETRSSAQDLVAIGQLALADPVLREIVASQSRAIGESTFTSTNTLAGTEGVTGLKTGFTNEAGYCLVLSKKVTTLGKEYEFIVAVLGQPSRSVAASEASRLVEVAVGNIVDRSIVTAGRPVGRMVAPWGSSANIIAKEPVSTTVWRSDPTNPAIRSNETEWLPSGTRVGYLTIDSAETELVLDSDLPKPSLWWRLRNVF